jgi:hypothetical protein
MPRIPGFRRIERLSLFNACRPALRAARWRSGHIGLAVDEKYTNSRGIWSAASRDARRPALGYAMLARSGDKGSFLTAHLAVDYAGAARPGDWIESKVEIQHVGSRLAFANCYLVVDGKPIVRASAIFARAGKSE